VNDTAFVLALIIALAYYFAKTRGAKKRHPKKPDDTNDEQASEK